MNTGRYIVATLVRAHCLWCCGQFVAGLAAVCFAGSVSLAAPITFAFDGKVREIDKSTNASFDLPFTVSVGDPLSGLVTVEPLAFGEKGTAPSLEVLLAGKTFRATGLPVVTNNNVMFVVGFQIVGPLDELGVGCTETQSGCLTIESPLAGEPLTDMGIGFSDGDVANFGEPIDSAQFLNRFAVRTAVLVFGNIFQDGSISVYGDIGAFREVPEPSTVVQTLLCVALSVGLTAHRQSRTCR